MIDTSLTRFDEDGNLVERVIVDVIARTIRIDGPAAGSHFRPLLEEEMAELVPGFVQLWSFFMALYQLNVKAAKMAEEIRRTDKKLNSACAANLTIRRNGWIVETFAKRLRGAGFDEIDDDWLDTLFWLAGDLQQ